MTPLFRRPPAQTVLQYHSLQVGDPAQALLDGETP
jgi:hypothetical protein